MIRNLDGGNQETTWQWTPGTNHLRSPSSPNKMLQGTRRYHQTPQSLEHDKLELAKSLFAPTDSDYAALTDYMPNTVGHLNFGWPERGLTRFDWILALHVTVRVPRSSILFCSCVCAYKRWRLAIFKQSVDRRLKTNTYFQPQKGRVRLNLPKPPLSSDSCFYVYY